MNTMDAAACSWRCVRYTVHPRTAVGSLGQGSPVCAMLVAARTHDGDDVVASKERQCLTPSSCLSASR